MVEFLGYRNDIVNLLPMCDVAVASSLREGLPVNIMEAMACGLPVVATENRGHNELIVNQYNGWTVSPENINDMANKIILLANEQHLITTLGDNGRDRIEKTYSVNSILNENSHLYERYMKEMEGIRWVAQ
jgi:glycosyltransferase EpsD